MIQRFYHKILDGNFYESDVVYMETKSNDKATMATDQQLFLVVLSTTRKKQYSQYINLYPIAVDNQNYNENFISRRLFSSTKRKKLNIDRKIIYGSLKNNTVTKKSYMIRKITD